MKSKKITIKKNLFRYLLSDLMKLCIKKLTESLVYSLIISLFLYLFGLMPFSPFYLKLPFHVYLLYSVVIILPILIIMNILMFFVGVRVVFVLANDWGTTPLDVYKHLSNSTIKIKGIKQTTKEEFWTIKKREAEVVEIPKNYEDFVVKLKRRQLN